MGLFWLVNHGQSFFFGNNFTSPVHLELRAAALCGCGSDATSPDQRRQWRCGFRPLWFCGPGCENGVYPPPLFHGKMMRVHWVLIHPVFRQTYMENGPQVMDVYMYLSIYLSIYIYNISLGRKGMMEMGENDDQWINWTVFWGTLFEKTHTDGSTKAGFVYPWEVCMYIHILHTHTHIYIYTHAYRYRVHACIPTYLHTYIPSYLNTYIPTYLHTYIHT